MQIIFKEVNKKLKEYKDIKRLYIQSFPREELISFWLLKWKARKQSNKFYSVYDNEKWVGLVYLINWNKITYLLYLAINEDCQKRGYGTSILAKIKEISDSNSIVLCIEEVNEHSKNYEQRLRRKQFYIKNGFRDSGYRSKEVGIIYEMLVYGKDITGDAYEEVMKMYFGNILYKLSNNYVYKAE